MQNFACWPIITLRIDSCTASFTRQQQIHLPSCFSEEDFYIPKKAKCCSKFPFAGSKVLQKISICRSMNCSEGAAHDYELDAVSLHDQEKAAACDYGRQSPFCALSKPSWSLEKIR